MVASRYTAGPLFSAGISMNALPPCPQCQSALTYEDGDQLVCPECGQEWNTSGNTSGDASGRASADGAVDGARVYRDSAGNVLQDGDTVTVIKDLKPKGSGGVIKQGTKVKNIRLVDSDHDIDCKIDGFGAMSLKTEFVKKV
jgi:protein PhnA